MALSLRLAATAMLALVLALIVACMASPSASISPTMVPTEGPSTVAPGATTPPHRPRQHSTDHVEGLGEPIDAAHFIDSFPNHAQTLTQSPARVGINFDLPLTDASNITLERDGEPISVGVPAFDPRRIYMSVTVPPASGDGLYLARYHACFGDGNCGDGQIGFRVDAAGVKNFVDLTGQAEVMIHLEDVTYQPNQIIVSPGTMVTWVNDDPFDHFVNSDPHPSHNAFPDFNSLDIPPSGTFSYTFDEAGEYAFHCSAHVPQNMYGTILVRENEQFAASPTPRVQAAPASTVIAQAEPTVTPLSPTVAPTIAPTNVPATPVPPTPVPAPPEPTASTVLTTGKVPEENLPPQRFAAHFVSSVPAHADLVPIAPERIQINFDFVLARNSNINVRKDGEKVTLGDLEFSENRLQMSVALPNLGAGTYHVLYRACWPDKSCHDGEFAIVVGG